MLTKADRSNGPPYLVVGTLADGSQVVLAEADSQDQADAMADEFRRQLEGYRSVNAELVGEPARTPQWTIGPDGRRRHRNCGRNHGVLP